MRLEVGVNVPAEDCPNWRCFDMETGRRITLRWADDATHEYAPGCSAVVDLVAQEVKYTTVKARDFVVIMVERKTILVNWKDLLNEQDEDDAALDNIVETLLVEED